MIYLFFWLAALLSPYWLGPIVVWLTQRPSARPLFQPFDPGRHTVPEDVAAAMRQTCEALATEGFRVVADLFQTGQVTHVGVRVGLLENPATAELALAITVFSAARPARIVASYVELPTKFRDGRSLSVNNSPRLGSFAPRPPRAVVQFLDVRDPARLCGIKRAYLGRHYRGVEVSSFEHQGDPARFLSEALTRELTEQVEAGTWRRDDHAGVFRPTFSGAWVMTWRLLPPFTRIRKARLRRRAAQILRDLDMEGPDARPIAQPRTRYSIPWLLLLVAAVLALTYFGNSLLSRFPGLSRADPVTLPRDFVVPGTFARAVQALERLAGAAATPLIGTDSLGDSLVTEGVAVDVASTRAAGFVAAAQPRFLEKGFYLFRSEQRFGIEGQPDRVALFPRADPYEILVLMGTNGWNYDIGPDSIVGWLRALERDQPFVLTGIGFDWIEGRFTGGIGDAAALARRFYAFCPDIVDQGTATVEALAAELRKSKALYCWWD
ncbi:MAG TPA: DUF4253 domain-containing protein [Gemmatimonadales bacterium]|nr:DUF4253 domain-containing protein [Gemmatimonadales bacterium]